MPCVAFLDAQLLFERICSKRKMKDQIVLSPLLCQSTEVETSCREDVLVKSLQEETIFVLILSKATDNSLRQKEYGL